MEFHLSFLSPVVSRRDTSVLLVCQLVRDFRDVTQVCVVFSLWTAGDVRTRLCCLSLPAVFVQ